MSDDRTPFSGTERYTDIRLLGSGGMGEVYEVEDTVTGQRLALKVMQAPSAWRLLRFKKEFRALAELHHPGLAHLFELVCEDERWFFTMELVEGQDLLAALSIDDTPELTLSSQEQFFASELDAGDTLEPEPRPSPLAGPACDLDALRLALVQLLDVLEYLHSEGIVHRDLKPSNIFIDVSGKVRVLDFGLVTEVERVLETSPSGAVAGTLAYLSPEQLEGKPATPASDLYALGCILFQLLTGRLPYAGSPAAILQARLTGPSPHPGKLVGGLPEPLVAVCCALIAQDPAARPDIDGIRAALGVASADSNDVPTLLSPSGEIFVGRRAELDQLKTQLELARGGALQFALISGASGMGKSTLASKIARRARQSGFLCFEGRCYEREQVPYSAFDRAVDAMALTMARWPEHLKAPITPALRAIEPIFPVAGILTSSEAAETSADPRERSQKAFAGFCEVIDHCQAQSPVMLVLDDLQWAGEEDIELMLSVLTRCSGRILVLALFRPEGMTQSSPLARLGSHARRKGAETLQLEPLEPGEVVRLVSKVPRGGLDPEAMALLTDQAQGNPFLIHRLTGLLGALGEEAFADLTTDSISFDALIGGQLSALSASTEHVLSLMATAGGDISRALLQQVSALSASDFEMAVSELTSRKLLKVLHQRGEAGRLDFYHDRLRESAYRRLEEGRRRKLHETLALAIEANPEERARQAVALLQHWSAVGNEARQRRFALEAADQAEAKLAFAHAAHLLRTVLELSDEAPLAQAEQWERAARLHDYSGALTKAAEAFKRALALWEASEETTQERDLAVLRLTGRVGETLMLAGHIGQARPYYERIMGGLGIRFERRVSVRVLRIAWRIAQKAILPRLPGAWASGRPRPCSSSGS